MDIGSLLALFQSGPQGSPAQPPMPGMPPGGPTPIPGLGIPSQAGPPSSGSPDQLANSGYEDPGSQFRPMNRPSIQGGRMNPFERGGGPVGSDPMNFADHLRSMLGMRGINSFGDLGSRAMDFFARTAGALGGPPTAPNNAANSGANPERPGGMGNPATPAPPTQRPAPGTASTAHAAQGTPNVTPQPNLNGAESFLQGVGGEPSGPGTVGAAPAGSGTQGSQMSNIGAALAGVKAEPRQEPSIRPPSVDGGAAPRNAENIILEALGLGSMKRPEPLGLSGMLGTRG